MKTNAATWGRILSIAAIAVAVHSGVALARCGDAAGDMTGVSDTRAAVDMQCDCAGFATRGDYMRCVRGVIQSKVDDHTLNVECRGRVMRCASKSTCGRPGYVTCCRTNARGKTSCRIKPSASKCAAPVNGSACVGYLASCCDACGAGGCITPTPTATPTVTPTRTIPAICQGVNLTPLAHVPVTIDAGSPNCGGAKLTPNPDPPFSGEVDDGNQGKLHDLGLGCLYTGALPPLVIPDGSSAILDVVGVSPTGITLAGSAGNGPSDCTKGAGPLRHCSNGAPGKDTMGLCDNDSDCRSQVGACNLDANCYFGPPVPVALGPLSTCIVNAFDADLCGQINLTSNATLLSGAISSRIYTTGNATSPCPRCESGMCSYGKNAGQPCTGVGSLQTTNECPPNDNTFLGALPVVLAELTSGTSTITADANGKFCTGQNSTGAFGLTAAREVTEVGVSTGGGGNLQDSTLVSTFCIYPTGSFVDQLAGLPAVGALSAKSTIDLSGAVGLPPLP